MSSSAEQERQWREEHFDWLRHQVQLMQHQLEMLDRIARHTGLVFVVMIIWLVLMGLGLLGGLAVFAAGMR